MKQPPYRPPCLYCIDGICRRRGVLYCPDCQAWQARARAARLRISADTRATIERIRNAARPAR
jgi:hypothetical protein